jgi:cation diffusion facilitator CzcD-associated flavoprotein CzcO
VETFDAAIIGAGPAGLAAARQLKARGLNVVIFEKAETVGSVWRRHYDRLHLHTARAYSGLPGMAIPSAYGRYPSRAQFVDYLESYAAGFELRPRFNTPVSAVRREGQGWRVEAGVGSVAASTVVVATGWADFPYTPKWPGMSEFGGPIVHSSRYRAGALYAGKRVLVVGFGNSGAEIALDLCEAGADVTLAVRSPVSIVPRDVMGLPIQSFSILERFLPTRVADFLNAPVIRLTIGSLDKLGLKRAAKGALQMIAEDGRAPVIDIGAVAKIRSGAIKVRGGIDRFLPGGVAFVESGEERFDAVILATGFRPDLRSLLPDAVGVLDAAGKPLVSDRATAAPGIFFVGAIPTASGQLREIAIGATRVADLANRFLSGQNARAS